MKIGRYLLLGVVVIGAIWFGVRQYRRHRASRPPVTSNESAIALPMYDDSAYNTRAPDSTRIRVEVLNATQTRGLARRATIYLRDRGFDVVLIGNVKPYQHETVVYDRLRNPQWTALVARAMQGRAQLKPDTLRNVDVTVVIGDNWTPPAQPFYP